MNRLTHHRTIATALVVCLVALGAGYSALAKAPAEASAGPSGAGQAIDINRASVEDLTEIPGIGKSLAQRIVDFRDEHGPFKRVDDLLKIRGIGEKSLEKIRPHVKVAGKG